MSGGDRAVGCLRDGMVEDGNSNLARNFSLALAVASFDEKQSLIGSAGHSMAKAGNEVHMQRSHFSQHGIQGNCVHPSSLIPPLGQPSLDDIRLYMNARDAHPYPSTSADYTNYFVDKISKVDMI
jgi:hypothetical protein